MVTVKLSRDLNMHMYNIPDNFFYYIKYYLGEDDGEMMFNTEQWLLYPLQQAISEYKKCFINQQLVNDMYEYSLVTAIYEDLHLPLPFASLPVRNINEYDVVMPRVEAAIEPDEMCPEYDLPLNECECGKYRDVEVNNSETIDLQRLNDLEKLDDAIRIKAAIASKLNEDTSNRAKMLSDKYIAYNRNLASLMSLQNEINRLSTLIGANPIVESLKEQVEHILSKDNLVENIYFTNDFLVVQTQDIITEALRDGKKRKIGKMQFFIRLSAMIGSNNTEAPILIRNMTRESGQQECGHVGNTGLPCFGSWSEPILKTVQALDIDQLIDILIRFVKNPNEDDCMGITIRHWPITVED